MPGGTVAMGRVPIVCKFLPSWGSAPAGAELRCTSQHWLCCAVSLGQGWPDAGCSLEWVTSSHYTLLGEQLGSSLRC